MINNSINERLAQSTKLENKLVEFLSLQAFTTEKRIKVSRILCSVVYEHAESVKILIPTGNLTSSEIAL
jgi:hypothetical protein